nr:FHIPEP family type III secretion protein [Shewanella atlantica]
MMIPMTAALNLGYSVVDNAIVLSDRLAKQSPKLAESLSTALTPIQQLKVYRLLLKEQVSLKDIRTIATTLLDCSENSKDPVLLAADVRCALRNSILHSIAGPASQINVLTLAPELEQTLMTALNQSQQQGKVALDSFPVEPQLLAQLQQKMPQILAEAKEQGHSPMLLVSPQLRPILARYALAFARGLHVLSYNEIPETRELMVAGQLG